MSHNPKKVLIVTYYWPPSGGSGVQRWLKFVKYLRRFGWEPIVYVPENPEYPAEDLSLANDIPSGVQVIKTPIWEPYRLYRRLTGEKEAKISAGFISENRPKGWKDKLSIWLRGNVLIPDPRVFWVKPSVRYLTGYLKQQPVDVLITTGPPHSMHLIGYGLKKAIPELKWVADFRDPWTNIDFYKSLHLTPIADSKHRRWERRVVRSADAVLVVSNEMVKEFTALQPQRIELITNGYDEDDLSGKTQQQRLDEPFTLSHVGTLNADRNPHILWKALNELMKSDAAFREQLQVKLVGSVDHSVLDSIQKNGLINNLVKIDYVSHQEAVALQQASQVLLLLINRSPNAKGILTGKFFEYLASRRPILAIGPQDSDVATVLRETKAGEITDFEDIEGMKRTIQNYYKQYQQGKLAVSPEAIDRFSRKSLTRQLAIVLDALLKD